MDDERKMIKLKDFAIDRNVTERAIQKHIQRHEEELKGEVERRGPNGTWLTEAACEKIKKWMIQRDAIVVVDTETVDENEELKNQIYELQTDLRTAEKLIRQLLSATSNGMLEGGNQRLLTAAQDQIEAMEQQRKEDQEKLIASAREAERAEQERKAAQERAEAAEAKIEALRNRTLWERLTRKGE